MKKRIFALALMLVLLASVCLAVPMEASADDSDNSEVRIIYTGGEPWERNVLIWDPLSAFGIDKELIGAVTFLDTVKDAPRTAWYLGYQRTDFVLGWIEWEYGMAHVYIAGKGGINASICCPNLFEGCTYLGIVEFNGVFHTDEAESMRNMFRGCRNLTVVDFEGFNTSKVVSMYQMFRDCMSLKDLDVSSFDTSNVETMYCMFSTCGNLIELDLEHFDTSKVTNMGYMFSACKRLEEVKISTFDTAQVFTMEGMLRWCPKLKDLAIKDWDLSSLNNHLGFMDEGKTINGEAWKSFFE